MGRELRQIVEGIIGADTSGLASSRVKKAAGDTVLKEGDKGHFMYHVEDGMIEIVHNSTVLETVETGGIVGEMALVEEDGREVQTRWFDATLHLYCSIKDDFALEVMKFLTRRVREMSERL